jgi:hypothetical protein
MILVMTECHHGVCLHVVWFCYCRLYVLKLLGKFSSVFRLFGSVVWNWIVGVSDVVILWCQFDVYYFFSTCSFHNTYNYFQLEFNYIAQGDVNNKGTHFMFRLKNARLICPISAGFEIFAAVMMKILECWTVRS